MAYQTADAKKEEYRKYLEKAGVIDALTKVPFPLFSVDCLMWAPRFCCRSLALQVLVGLYEEPERPPNAQEYLKRSGGSVWLGVNFKPTTKPDLDFPCVFQVHGCPCWSRCGCTEGRERAIEGRGCQFTAPTCRGTGRLGPRTVTSSHESQAWLSLVDRRLLAAAAGAAACCDRHRSHVNNIMCQFWHWEQWEVTSSCRRFRRYATGQPLQRLLHVVRDACGHRVLLAGRVKLWR
jgi:hypothetical protein